VDANVHRKAQRKNIPTAELEAFAEDDERQPKALLYPRDPSLDPQLVWKGKDEQDRHPLQVPSVPIYIQEKISPQAIIEELRAENAGTTDELQIQLFSDFNGLPFEQMVDFYQHDQKWTNRMILGDSLLVMASLAEKEGLKGKVQMIYVDPPYGIKFGSNWQVSTRKRDVRDGRAEDVTRQPEQVKAFRDTWQLGINSYLAYLRDRLALCRELLVDSGSIFVQIGDDNVHLVRNVLDEVFGRTNCVAQIVLKTTSGAGSPSGGTLTLAHVNDYVLWYARDRERVKYRQLFLDKEDAATTAELYRHVRLSDGTVTSLSRDQTLDSFPAGARLFRASDLTSQSSPESATFPVQFRGMTIRPAKGGWKTNAAGMKQLILADRLSVTQKGTLRYIRYLDDFSAYPLNNVWTDVGTGSFTEEKVFVVQTNVKIVQRCILMSTDPGDLVIDPTCGSGTTALVAEQWGRRWITVDTSRVALALARTRLMSARYPYYLLADSAAGAHKIAELGEHPPTSASFSSDISRGFVYERVPHVTLKSIANNSEIHEGMSPQEINASIARHAETELLYDRPYVDTKVVRVSGPFTVESLSPHRALQSAAESDGNVPNGEDSTSFVERIIDYLRKAGVQNTVKNERLVFERLDQWPGGVYIQASGDYLESGSSRTVAVAIGPEYGTVGPEFVREASKEAVKFADLLVVCGFAFEPIVGDDTTHLGRLSILKARMNPDLSMGDELLKKTGAGNLFMVFGEPDIRLKALEGGMFSAEILGVDVYDPTTGVIRSHSTDDIACWFVDTDYSGNSFFVRHAYFLGAGDPYGKLRRALRVEINESTWSTLNSTISRPFPKPESGKIAVKVINHYGDEVMRVFTID